MLQDSDSVLQTVPLHPHRHSVVLQGEGLPPTVIPFSESTPTHRPAALMYIQFPSTGFSGGSLTVQCSSRSKAHVKTVRMCNWGSVLSYAAHYHDCSSVLETVSSGHRVLVVYALTVPHVRFPATSTAVRATSAWHATSLCGDVDLSLPRVRGSRRPLPHTSTLQHAVCALQLGMSRVFVNQTQPDLHVTGPAAH